MTINKIQAVFLLFLMSNYVKGQKVYDIPSQYNSIDTIGLYIYQDYPNKTKNTLFTIIFVNPTKDTLTHYSFPQWREKILMGESWNEANLGWMCSSGATEIKIPPNKCLINNVHYCKEGENIKIGIEYYKRDRKSIIEAWTKPFSYVNTNKNK